MAESAASGGAIRSSRGRWEIGRTRFSRLIMLWTLNACFLLFFLFPFFWLTTTALKSPDEVDTLPIRWLPSHLYGGNFQAVFGYLHFQTYLANSVMVACSTTGLSLALSAAAAYALAQLPLPAKRTLLVLVVSMVTISSVTLVPSLYLLFRDLGWLNTRKALLAPYVATSLPFAIWILTNAFREIPGELSEQGEVDGCTPLQVCWRVILPLASPTLLTAALVIFLVAWNEYLFAMMFILDTHARIETAQVALANAEGGWGVIAAASEILIAPIILFVLFFQNRIVQGLTAGALKG